jgi:uncharacterized protein YegL
MQAEKTQAQRETPRALRLSLAHLGIPVPAEVKELADKAAGSKPVSSEEAQKAAVELNQMIQEQHQLLDHKIVSCREKRNTIGEAIHDAANAVRDLAAETSAARSIIVEATSRIPQDRRSFQEFKLQAASSRSRCQDTSDSHKAETDHLERDATGVAAVQKALQEKCAGSSLLQTAEPSEPAMKSDDAADSRSHGVSVMHARKMKDLVATGCSDVAAALGMMARKRGGQIAGGFMQEITEEPVQCTLTAHTCAAMLDVAAEVAGEIADSQARLRKNAAEARDACADEDMFIKNQLSMETGQASDRSQELDEATWRAGEVGDLVNKKDAERQELQAELESITSNCTRDIDGILYGKMCAMQRVRDSLYLLSGSSELPEDCQVTEWEEGTCSTTCGGGTRELTRSVILPAWGGAECPPLKMTLRCGETACPVDCEVSLWTNWSACSAQCNGGVQERNRVVNVQPVGNGVACPHLVDMRLCNTQACTSECELRDWTTWTPCSRACDGGTQLRTRDSRDEGLANCPRADSSERLESRDCSEDKCNEKAEGVKCAGGALDVVLLVDSSASMTDSGFETVKKLSLELVKGYSLNKTGTKLAVASFSNQAEVLSILSDDSSSLSSKLSSDLNWLKGPSNAGAALTRAINLLGNGGRQEASSLVLMITDGRPVDPFLAKQAAEKLKANGIRLAFALVGTAYKNSELLEGMASYPDKDNIIQLPAFAELDKDLGLAANRIIAGTCSAITEEAPENFIPFLR